MFRHIAVGLDGSVNGAAAVDAALALGRRLDAIVHGVHVVDTALLEGSFIADITGALGVEPLVNLTARVEEVLADLASTIEDSFRQQAEAAGADCRFVSARGAVAATLVEQTQTCGLLAVGTRGVNARYHGDLLGPVTERLLRLSRIPILVVPEAPTPIASLLLAYDGSPPADRALRWGGELAGALAIPVTVLTVQSEETEAAPLLARAAAHLEPLGLAADTTWRSGGPAEVILQLAGERGIDLLCLGAHRRSRLVEMVLGSTTETVLRHAGVPVLCVP